MILKMYIGNIYVAKSEFDFVEMETSAERVTHLEKLRACLYWENWQQIKFIRKEPHFFYEAQSKLNDLTHFELMELHDISDETLKQQLKEDEPENEDLRTLQDC
jgi:hypothetical protein